MKTIRVTFQFKNQSIQQSHPFEVLDSCKLETIQEEIPRKLSRQFGIPTQDIIILGYMVISEINQEQYSPLNDLVERVKGLCKTPESYRRVMLMVEEEIIKFHEDNLK